MEYILICIAAAFVCIYLGFCVTEVINKIIHKEMTRLKKIFVSLGYGIVIIVIVSFVYLSIYYKADRDVFDLACNSKGVSVEKIDGGYFFDGYGEDIAMVFFPGAKVDERAYSLLMTEIAGLGIDCFIVKVPFHMAMFGSNIPDKFMENYDYNTWVMAGHSMGGIVAASYANNHTDKVSGLVMLASYPTGKISADIAFCSIYGSEDGCLNLDAYKKGQDYWPWTSMEKIIEGGNHAQFGNYGFQKGDGEATISPEEQRGITAHTIAKFLMSL